MNFSMKEFIQLRDLVYQRTGLFFEEKKIFFISKRLEQRIKETDCTSVLDYIRLLKFSDPNGIEFQNFINITTTNETYFFREFDQLACFAEDCLPEITARKLAEDFKHLNIWCAACSTGEEAFTLSIIVKVMLLDENPDWKCAIFANDIDENVLKIAKKGIFSERSIKDVPAEYLDKYFVRIGSNYKIKPEIHKMVTLEHMNLSDRAKMRKQRNFDFIFCRNTLIYFDDNSRKEVVDHFFNALNPGGYIYLGHTESVGRITNKFKLRRFGKNLVYQKPLK